MEMERSQQPATGPHREPGKSNAHSYSYEEIQSYIITVA